MLCTTRNRFVNIRNWQSVHKYMYLCINSACLICPGFSPHKWQVSQLLHWWSLDCMGIVYVTTKHLIWKLNQYFDGQIKRHNTTEMICLRPFFTFQLVEHVHESLMCGTNTNTAWTNPFEWVIGLCVCLYEMNHRWCEDCQPHILFGWLEVLFKPSRYPASCRVLNIYLKKRMFSWNLELFSHM